MVKPLTFLTLRSLSSASVNVKILIFSLRAEVMKNELGFYIDMYSKDKLVESRPLYDHSEVYAESAAENYVMGILNP